MPDPFIHSFMARKHSIDRFNGIVEAGLRQFMNRGYHRTRVDEVAKLAGVSSGTVYNYCATKEALFELCLARGFGDRSVPEIFPHRAKPSVSVIDQAWTTFVLASRFDALVAVEDGSAQDTYNIDDITRATYDWMAQNRRGIRLIERCARDWPELASYFYVSFRRKALSGFAKMIDGEVSAGRLSSPGPSDVTARIIIELCAYFAMHRHGDMDSENMDDEVVRSSVLAFVRAALRPAGVNAIGHQ